MGDLIQGPWAGPSEANLGKLQMANAESVTVRTVERWLEHGCPHERENGRVLFHVPTVRKWLREQRQDGAA